MYDEISRQVASCNDEYNFVSYALNRMQEFVVDNVVIVSVFLEKFPLEIVRKLHFQHANSYKVSMRIASTSPMA